ncbi:hypothetical protein [Aestuariivirga sp.]|uniref:hypothetical protein n=1 Tax=Aestuariivirga sp. TaxID=2650926 RepID=UPI003017F69C
MTPTKAGRYRFDETGGYAMRIGFLGGCAAIILGLSITAVFAAPGREIPLGTINYEAQPVREVINIRRGEGALRGLRLEVRQNDVDIRDLRVTYDDGSSDIIRINQVVRAGVVTRVFDLDSRRREVRSVAVSYLPQGQARIVLIGVGGMPGPGPGPGPADWSLLGCKDIKFLSDRDTLKVSREGRFGALRVKVRKTPVEMYSLRVTYLSGAKQEVPVRETIPPGGVSRPIELLGRERGIERIEVIYRAMISNKGLAEVCIDGLER